LIRIKKTHRIWLKIKDYQAQQSQAQQSQAQQSQAQQSQAQQSQAQQSQAQQLQQHPVSVNSSKEAFKGLSYSRLNNDNTEYNVPFVYYKNSSVTSNGNGSDYKNKDQLIEKLNYMILLLEEQQNERTGHIMEELILYAFLGIFMIFIVDSFVRAGKYVR
jgi:hypothetical protein